jgi:hypothetical protein
MDIASGLAGLKTASDLVSGVRNALIKPDVKPDEILGRLIELQGLISDGRTALIDMQEQLITKTGEIQQLRNKLRQLEEDHEFHASLTFNQGVYKRNGPRGEEVYCAACYDEAGKRIRVSLQGNDYWCTVKHYRI